MNHLPLFRFRLFTVFLACASAVQAGPDSPIPPVSPPKGIAVPTAVRAELEQGAEALGREIESLRAALKAKPALLELLPDVQIFHNAVRYALADDIFYRDTEFAAAKAQLKQGMERAASLRAGQSPWTTASGLVVRGFLSHIDGSVQPYGLVIPDSFHADSPHRHRLDVWFHGRSNNLSEVAFLAEHSKSPGQFTPPDAIVLHPYGRYCNANRFAGEVDFFEAMAHVKKSYRIDNNRIVVRGFSMGGAACWQMACHFAGAWAAAAPGAGFTDTPNYTGVLKKQGPQPPWYEQKLWHWYDCPEYAVNLSNVPLVAYTGEIDAAMPCTLLMEKAMADEGMKLVHVIGPQTGHKYHPDSKELINQRIDAIAEQGREPLLHNKIRFATWTLRYNQMGWITIDAMGKHWEEARVAAELRADQNQVIVTAKNITGLTLNMEPGHCPFDTTKPVKVVIDGSSVSAPQPSSDRSWIAHFQKKGIAWSLSDGSTGLRKRHGLQGPIDDAFTDDFVFVHPTGKPLNDNVGKWCAAEETRAVREWHRQFRGEARTINDAAVTDADIAAHNLILWGDPQSNKILARIADKLPIQWTAQGVQVGTQTYPSSQHVPVLIFPNPLNPNKYVVLNSGFTFREDAYGSNAFQTPKLPDFAVIDVSVPATAHSPGGIVNAGFFGEQWELLPEKK